MSVETGGRKFKDDRVINLINKNFVSLKDSDMKRNNEILHGIINEVVAVVKEKNEFFKEHYRNIMFVGSFYKGTKVGKPEEFDLDMIIQLPLKYESIEFDRSLPGYTKLKLNADSYKPGWERHKKILAKWVTPEGYLNQHEFFQYMESAFTNLPKSVDVGEEKYELCTRKSGPAFTLCVKGSNSLEMSVDLVPVLEFRTPPPVPGDFSGVPWFAVPKTPKSKAGLKDPHLHWRMSFYGFEKCMLRKHGALKPVIRQLKKLRDRADWKLIASYHIETLFLHRVKAMEENPELQKCSSMQHLVDMLGQLKEACETNRIVNFWDKSHNLIEDVKPTQLVNIKGRLEKIIKHVEKDSFAIAEYVLTTEERETIESELNGYRNAGKPGATDEPKPVQANDVKLMHTKSCNAAPSSESEQSIKLDPREPWNPATSFGHFGPREVLDRTVKTIDKPQRETVSAATDDEKSTANKTERNDGFAESTANKTERNDGFAEIMNILKSMQKDIAETKDSVNLLVRLAMAGEQKIEAVHRKQHEGFADNLCALKSMRSDSANTGDAVSFLTRRVAAVEEKVETLLSRSKSGVDEQAVPILDRLSRMGEFCHAQS